VATGDCSLSVSVEGGVTKTVAIDSATRVLALAFETARTSGNDDPINTDAEWQVLMVNYLADRVVLNANRQQEAGLSYTAKTYTAAT
tara:strand:+ start:74 stop:334 length:261 start_codon:yes stop_codon:yes gene_type:complete